MFIMFIPCMWVGADESEKALWRNLSYSYQDRDDASVFFLYQVTDDLVVEVWHCFPLTQVKQVRTVTTMLFHSFTVQLQCIKKQGCEWESFSDGVLEEPLQYM